MILFFTFLLMFISSASLILYFNHLTQINEQETKRMAIQSKFRTRLQNVKLEEVDKHLLVKAC
ncbi:MAG: hypothetical protein JWR87_3527 [Segetibacter sp.]|jgi:hypothetical protein|nr:hypothetical protein [Segetibacter sp.]